MKSLLTVSLALTLLLTACSDSKPVDTTEVDTITRTILQQIAAGEYSKTYQSFAESYRQRVTPSAWQQEASLYHDALGELVDLRRDEALSSTVRLEDSIEGSFTYRATWNKGPGVVHIGMSRNGQWQVVTFTIDSPLFVNRSSAPSPTPMPATAPDRTATP